jgi:hypothetical protein
MTIVTTEQSDREAVTGKPEILHGWRRNRLRYGFNEIDGWPGFAFGDKRHEIHRRLRLMNTEVVRLFVFDKPVPNPLQDWRSFAAVIEGVLASGAKPMITFAKFAPYYSPRELTRFIARTREVVWGCLEEWGGSEVKDWYWCVWNEPNNPDVGGNLSYADYLHIYREVADTVVELVARHSGGSRVKIGGPAIDGTQRAYWLDWIARILSDVEDDRLAFVNWHMYADWRPAVAYDSVTVKLVDDPVPPASPAFEALTLAQTPQYEARARSVGRLIGDRDILNVCGELNTIAHHEHHFTGGLNRNVIGGAYYASALVNLMRGGADLEMRWTATSKHWYGRDDAYGLMDKDGVPTSAALAKQILAQHVGCGDEIMFPEIDDRCRGIESVISRNALGRRSAVLINTQPQTRTIPLASLGAGIEHCVDVLRIDGGTNGAVVREAASGVVHLQGYGLAVVSEDASATIIE